MSAGRTEHELDVLEMGAGHRDWETGAATNASLEALRDSGLITQYLGARPALTPQGLAALFPRSQQRTRVEESF